MRTDPRRGEVWRVALDPTLGSEVQKTRPAIVASSDVVGRLALRLIVPLTGWDETYRPYFWMTRVDPTAGTGLSKPSAADAFQMRSVALVRFRDRLGTLPEAAPTRIARAVALTVEYEETP